MNVLEKRSLRQFISQYLCEIISIYYRFKGCEIGRKCQISKSAVIDRANPRGVHIGDHTRVLIQSMILAHDYSRSALPGCSMWLDTRIGHHCVIGGRSMIMPGVTLGDHVYVAGGSVVTKSFPSNCLIAGNPAKIIRKGTVMNDMGQIIEKGERV